MYFRYSIQSGTRHNVLYIKTTELIMLPHPMEGSHDRRRKTHSHKIDQIDRVDTRLDQFIKQVIIGRQQRHYLASICPSCLCLSIVMPVAALVTAEAFISPSIPYLHSAMKTPRQYPYYLLIVTHLSFFSQISSGWTRHPIAERRFFYFFNKIFLFFKIKKNLKILRFGNNYKKKKKLQEHLRKTIDNSF